MFKWVASKCDYLLKRGVEISDFEDLRSCALSFINEKTDQQDKAAIIEVIVHFKNVLALKKAIANRAETPADQTQKEEPPQKQTVPVKSLGGRILDALESDFEKGLLMIKQTAQDLTSFDFASKEMVFLRLLQLVSVSCKNQQQ